MITLLAAVGSAVIVVLVLLGVVACARWAFDLGEQDQINEDDDRWPPYDR